MTVDQYAEQLLMMMGVTCEVALEDTEDETLIQISIPEEEAGLLIGHHGDTLVSLQRVLRIVFAEDQEKRLVVNVNDYRQQRVDLLEQMAEDAADRVLDSGRPYRFKPMPANERFIIHSFIAEHPDFAELTTYSEGEGASRHLVVDLAEEK